MCQQILRPLFKLFRCWPGSRLRVSVVTLETQLANGIDRFADPDTRPLQTCTSPLLENTELFETITPCVYLPQSERYPPRSSELRNTQRLDTKLAREYDE